MKGRNVSRYASPYYKVCYEKVVDQDGNLV